MAFGAGPTGGCVVPRASCGKTTPPFYKVLGNDTADHRAHSSDHERTGTSCNGHPVRKRFEIHELADGDETAHTGRHVRQYHADVIGDPREFASQYSGPETL